MNELFNCIDLSLGGKSKTQKRIAEFKNNIAWQNAYHHFATKGLSRYEIVNLEPCMSDRVVHSTLLYHGAMCVFEKDGAILALPAAPSGNPNLNGDYKSCWVYGRNGFNEEIPLFIPGAEENDLMKRGYLNLNQNEKPRGVFIRENPFMYPFINYCIDYAEKVADTMRTIDVTRANIKRPYIIAAEEQLVPTVKKFFEQRDNNMEYIVSTGVFPADKIAILPFETNAEAIKVGTDLIEWYYNDFDNKCFNNSNANPDKKERLLVDEVNSNNQSRDKEKEKFRNFLQGQLDFCNKCLGTNLKLKEEPKDDDIQRMDKDTETEQMAAGRSNSGDA